MVIRDQVACLHGDSPTVAIHGHIWGTMDRDASNNMGDVADGKEENADLPAVRSTELAERGSPMWRNLGPESHPMGVAQRKQIR